MITLKEIREIKDVFSKTHLKRDCYMQYCWSIYKMNCSMVYWTKQLCKAKCQPKGMHKIDASRRQEKCLVSFVLWDTKAVEPSRITARAKAHIQGFELKTVTDLFFHSRVIPRCLSSFVATMCVFPRDQQWHNLMSWENPKYNLPSCWYDMSPGSSRVVPSSVILSISRSQVWC